ncbi:MAG TPA: polysaccharide biosynthesis tyrosine autokinase [Actinomycetota bacterium]
MELRDYIRIVRRRRWLIALTFATCSALALLYSSSRPPTYIATAKVLIGPQTVDRNDAASAIQALTFSRDFLASYAEILRGRTLAERVVEQLQLDTPPAALVGRISSNVVQDTRIIQVRVSDTSRERSALIANTLTELFVSDVQADFAGGAGGVQASVIESAIPPAGRSAPAPMRDGILGAFLGLMIGVGGAVLLEQLDTRLRTREDVERALDPIPVLVTVPRLTADLARERRFAVDADPRGLVSEAFRILRTNVQFLAVDHPIRRVLITGALAGDGKTTISANLAASLSTAGYTTLLVETDLRRPTVHEYIDERPSPGISDVLVGRVTLAQAIRRTRIPGLSVLTSGALPPNPSELLGSQRMVEIIDEAGGMYDVLVLDTPPTLPVTDAVVLAPRTDGVILVVRAGETHRDAVRAAAEQFERVGVRILGVVFNAASAEASGYGYQYYYDKGYASAEPHAARMPRRGKEPPPFETSVPPAATGEWSGGGNGAPSLPLRTESKPSAPDA